MRGKRVGQASDEEAKSQTLAIEQVRAECIEVCRANGDNLGAVVEKARRRELEQTPAEMEADAEQSRQAV
jgi:hypothetical protein